MKFKRIAAAVGIAAAIAIVACSSGQSSSTKVGGGSSSQGDTGTVGGTLTIGAGVNVTSLNWSIGNGATPYTGTVNIGDAQSVEFVAGGILQGGGYTVTISGNDSNGGTCSGTSGTFTVVAGGLTQVGVNVTCVDIAANDAAVAADVTTGSVYVNANVTLDASTAAATQCPGISSFSINPAEVLLGQPAQLGLSTVGPTPVITWSVTGVSPTTAGGTFSPSANVANPTFLGNTPGSVVQITATVALPDSGICAGVEFTSLSADVTVEGAPPDSGTGPADTGTGPADTGTGPADTGTGPADTGTGAADTGTGVDAGPVALVPCTAVGQTNCVSCIGNGDGVSVGAPCTATEAVLVALDIKNGTATAPGPDPFPDQGNPADPANGCYNCLWFNGALDDVAFGDSGHECQDTSGNFTSGVAGSGTGNTDTFSDICVQLLTCITTGEPTATPPIAGGCAQTNGGIDNCYCGPGGGSPSSCPSNGAATNGVCKTYETNGFHFAPSDSTDILKNYSDKAEPSGVANQIIVAANANSCSQCLK